MEEVGLEDVAVNEPMFLTGDERAGTGVHLGGASRLGDICSVAVGEGAGKGGTLLRRGRRTTLVLSLNFVVYAPPAHNYPPSLPCPLAPAPDSPIIFVTRIPRSARRDDARSPKFLS